MIEIAVVTNQYDGPLAGTCRYEGRFLPFAVAGWGGWYESGDSLNELECCPRTYRVYDASRRVVGAFSSDECVRHD